MLQNKLINFVCSAKSASDYDPERGLKWSLDKLRRFLTAKHGVEAVSTLMDKIGQIIIYSLRSVQSIIVQVT
jgi:tubulin polyglutamylase TTLL9